MLRKVLRICRKETNRVGSIKEYRKPVRSISLSLELLETRNVLSPFFYPISADSGSGEQLLPPGWSALPDPPGTTTSGWSANLVTPQSGYPGYIALSLTDHTSLQRVGPSFSLPVIGSLSPVVVMSRYEATLLFRDVRGDSLGGDSFIAQNLWFGLAGGEEPTGNGQGGGSSPVNPPVGPGALSIALMGVPVSGQGQVWTPITLSSSVADPNGASGLTYSWSVTKNGAAYASRNTSSYIFVPDGPGTYTIALTATDQGGATGATSAAITVSNGSPGSNVGLPDTNAYAILQNYNGTTVPTNGDGNNYPDEYPPDVSGEGGYGTQSMDSTDGISGNSLKFTLTSGKLYAEFNPYNYANNPAYPPERSFARNYSQNPLTWQYNTYNYMSFWIQVPTTDTAFTTTGDQGTQIGTYVKNVTNADPTQDESNNGHYYHLVNLPNEGTWVHVILNMHPDHQRGVSGDPGVLLHPTSETQYNYFDALTRFYIDEPYNSPSTYPAAYHIANIQFYQDPYTENDQQVYSLAATYRASDNRLVVTWNRNMAEDTVNDEVRYSFTDIHLTGWNAATPAPGGIIAPLGSGAYNGMVYDTTALPLAGQSVVYIAIKPDNSNSFTEIAVPLNVG